MGVGSGRTKSDVQASVVVVLGFIAAFAAGLAIGAVSAGARFQPQIGRTNPDRLSKGTAVAESIVDRIDDEGSGSPSAGDCAELKHFEELLEDLLRTADHVPSEVFSKAVVALVALRNMLDECDM